MIPISIVTLVSGAPDIGEQQIIQIKLRGSGAPDNTDLVRRFRSLDSTQTLSDYNVQRLQLWQILTRDYTVPQNFA